MIINGDIDTVIYKCWINVNNAKLDFIRWVFFMKFKKYGKYLIVLISYIARIEVLYSC